jgi:hypothetical protein
MRTETQTRTIYTAAELKEANPRGFERALERYRRWQCDDPHWRDEHFGSLAAAMGALGATQTNRGWRLDDAPDIEGPRRVMAWVENNVLAPLRIRWERMGDIIECGPNGGRRQTERRKLAQYGASYRPGCIKPCPWTGYCVDDDLLETIVKEARDGETPAQIARAVAQRAEALWESEMEYACSKDAYLEDAEENGREFHENGDLA